MSGLTANQSVIDSPAYTAVDRYLISQDITLEDTQTAFCQPAEESATAGGSTSDTEERLWQLWKGVVALAASISDDSARQRLVDFVLSVAQRSEVQKDGQACQVQDMTLWSDLPIFGWQLRDSWNNAATDNDSPDTIQKWTNLNAFTACFVATAHAKTNDHPDESLYCIWTLRAALEEQQQPSDAALSAAAVWLINAASTIDEFSSQEKAFDGKVARAGSLFKDQEWRGFSKDRWRSWGQRLSDMQGGIQDEQTQSLVEQARTAMGEVKER